MLLKLGNDRTPKIAVRLDGRTSPLVYDRTPDRTGRSGRMYGRTITGLITGPRTGPKTGPTSDDDNSQTVHPNYLKFGVRIVLYQVSCHTKFQLIRMNGSRVIDVGTYSHNSTVSYGRNSLQY